MCKREIRFVDIWFVRHSLWYCLDWLRFWATFFAPRWNSLFDLKHKWFCGRSMWDSSFSPLFSHHFTGVVLYIWGCLRKSGFLTLASHISSRPAEYSLRTRIRTVLLLKVAARPQDRCNTCLCKRVLPNFLAFGELGNLATLTKCWGKDRMFLCNELLPSSLKKVISSQAQQNKAPLNQEGQALMYRVWGGCRNWPKDLVKELQHFHLLRLGMPRIFDPRAMPQRAAFLGTGLV